MSRLDYAQKIALAKKSQQSRGRHIPDTVKKFKALGVDIEIESGAGIKSGLPDSNSPRSAPP
jgi:NAD(P) transhydrogenase subunit alpha